MEAPEHLVLSLEPLDDFVALEPVDEDVETKSGLILPASAEAGCSSAVVTAVGPDAIGVDPGDKVLFPKDAGYDVRLGGAAVKLLRRHELIARVHD